MANGSESSRGGQGRRRRFLIGASIVAGVLLLLAVANAHLVYVAVTSEPECVPHATAEDDNSAPFRAAKPAC